ncbi:LrgB family protein [Microbacter margulisiae]|uniref:Putative murein hydrolase (TIGR00659 family) n=1 Tax=Microbacter margulisiae TaxID=1350067 RepID=A0A7W5H263_9PORP|nr:LrgB family protein [Microbacter margulisiae]MBB3187309.1 putative murein hydrolase (TIGR00659 family) [Microbacter margulisiae]
MIALLHSELFLLAFTLGVYIGAVWLYRRTKWMLLHPLLTSIVVIITSIKLIGVSYAEFSEATSIINFMLGLSVVALGFLLYEQLIHIRGNVKIMFASIVVGALVGIGSVSLIAWLMGANFRIIASLEPKSITTPIAITVSEHAGGIPSLTSVVVIVVGIFGGIIGPSLLRILGIESKLARGLALGSGAHAVGTARAMELGAVEGAVSGLAIGLMGVTTAILVPIINFIVNLIHPLPLP